MKEQMNWDEMPEAQKFIEIYKKYIWKRWGGPELLDMLRSGGFFTAPASTKYHGSYPGGLVDHSNNVYRNLVWLDSKEQREGRDALDPQSLAIAALLHDVCKMNQYILSPTGQQYIYNEWDEPIGHGEKSVIMIQRYIQLTPEEVIAIRWHMGAYDAAARSDLRELGRAFGRCRLAAMLHLADMMATHLDEREG